jgi:hypothetical protein
MRPFFKFKNLCFVPPLVFVSEYNKNTGFCKVTAKINTAQLVREQNPLRVEGREPTKGAPLSADWDH